MSRSRFAPVEVDVSYRPDGTMVLRSPRPLGDVPRSLVEVLARWAEQAPDRPFKGYLNQRAVLERWAAQVARLYAAGSGAGRRPGSPGDQPGRVTRPVAVGPVPFSVASHQRPRQDARP